MRTIIFILAVTVLAAPALAGAGDPVACAMPLTAATQNCGMCISDGTNPTAQCYDCKGGFYLTRPDANTGSCTRCAEGKGIAAGGSTSATTVRPSATTANSCTACHASCAQYLLPSAADSCTRCAWGFWANLFDASKGTGTCGTACGASKTRPLSSTDLTGPENAGLCVDCAEPCASCRGTAITCTKCAAGHYLSSKFGGQTVGTCTACSDGKGKDADASEFTETTAQATSDVCSATCTAASRCTTCSAAEPAKCILCAIGESLDASTKTCSKAAPLGSKSSAIVQLGCGALLAA